MTWTRFVGGILVVSSLLLGCTETSQAASLDQMTDAGLAKLMSQRCYDLRTAFHRVQDQHLDFKRSVEAMKQPYREILIVAQAMKHRRNQPLQFMRKYAQKGGNSVMKACELADGYETSSHRPPLDYHGGRRDRRPQRTERRGP